MGRLPVAFLKGHHSHYGQIAATKVHIFLQTAYVLKTFLGKNCNEQPKGRYETKKVMIFRGSRFLYLDVTLAVKLFLAVLTTGRRVDEPMAYEGYEGTFCNFPL